jgi:hypothetical protein
MPAYRVAGVTKWVGVTPSADMYTEAIPELNRLLAAWNCDGHKIYNTSIESFDLVADQKIFSIGPGGDFDTERPNFIRGANILLPTDPVVRKHVDILDDDQWRAIKVQDVAGAPPYQLYYDGGLDSTTGRGQIYLRFQAPADYQLELYTWQRLKTTFSASTDVAVFPDGYERALVYNLARSLAALNPHMATMSADAYKIADQSLDTIITLNTRSPRLHNDPALIGPDPGPGYGWLDGGWE